MGVRKRGHEGEVEEEEPERGREREQGGLLGLRRMVTSIVRCVPLRIDTVSEGLCPPTGRVFLSPVFQGLKGWWKDVPRTCLSHSPALAQPHGTCPSHTFRGLLSTFG